MGKKKDVQHNLSAVLESLMQNEGLTDAELARRTNLPPSSILKLRLKYSLNPTLETLIPICNYFHVEIDQLLGRKEITDLETHKIHFPRFKSQEVPIIEISEIEEWLSGRFHLGIDRQHVVTGVDLSDQAFGITVKGSMISQLFPEGSTLIFDKIDDNVQPPDRGYVAVILDKDERKKVSSQLQAVASNQLPTIKQIMIDGSDFFLAPFNPSLGGILTNPSCKILAVMRQTQTTYKND